MNLISCPPQNRYRETLLTKSGGSVPKEGEWKIGQTRSGESVRDVARGICHINTFELISKHPFALFGSKIFVDNSGRKNSKIFDFRSNQNRAYLAFALTVLSRRPQAFQTNSSLFWPCSSRDGSRGHAWKHTVVIMSASSPVVCGLGSTPRCSPLGT